MSDFKIKLIKILNRLNDKNIENPLIVDFDKTSLDYLIFNKTYTITNEPEYEINLSGTNNQGCYWLHNKVNNTLDFYMSFKKEIEYFGEYINVKNVWLTPNPVFRNDGLITILFNELRYNNIVYKNEILPSFEWWEENYRKLFGYKCSMTQFKIYAFSSSLKLNILCDKYDKTVSVKKWRDDMKTQWNDCQFIITNKPINIRELK
jgi:hypothetical protein